MRIIFDPIIVNPDGLSLNLQHRAPLLYLDPKKLTPQGVREAIFHANLDRATENLAAFGAADPALEKDHIISGMLTAPVRDEYREKVLAYAGQDSFSGHIREFLQSKLDYAGQHPDEFLDAIRTAIANPSAFDRFFTSHQPDIPEPKKRAYATKLDTSIKALPPHLKTLLEQEKGTIICANDIMDFIGADAAITYPDASLIGFVYSYLDRQEVKAITRAVKEELLHYLDYKKGTSGGAEFAHHAEALLGDSEKMQAIEDLSRKIFSEGGKTRIREYDADKQHGELLVEYFHIRDHLTELEHRRGCFGFVPGPQASEESIAAHVDGQMEKLFGNGIHAICKDFDDGLMRDAQALSAGHTGRLT